MAGIDVGMLFFVVAPIIILTAFAALFVTNYSSSQSHREV
jgi:hypothetical protein